MIVEVTVLSPGGPPTTLVVGVSGGRVAPVTVRGREPRASAFASEKGYDDEDRGRVLTGYLRADISRFHCCYVGGDRHVPAEAAGGLD